MFHRVVEAIRLRALVVAVLVHLGLGLSLAGLIQAARSGVESSALSWLIAGTILLYGSFLLAAFLIVWPILPWIRKARRLFQWREWILDELPRLLALLPALIQVLKLARDAWEELRKRPPTAP
jgi:hypothetical protein